VGGFIRVCFILRIESVVSESLFAAVDRLLIFVKNVMAYFLA